MLQRLKRLMSAFGEHRNVQLLLLSLLVGSVFGNTLFNYFVWDDFPILINNSAYKSIDLVRFFSTPANGLEYLPIRDISYAIDYALWGGNPFGYHLMNLLLYLGNVVAVYYLARRVVTVLTPAGETDGGTANGISFWTAALFAVHPLHSETVSFITCRNALLSGVFTFLACRFYLDYLVASVGKRCYPYLAALAGYILAVLSKGTSIFLPLFFVPCVLLVERRRFLRGMLALLPFFAVAGSTYYLFISVAQQVKIIDPVVAKMQRFSVARLAEAVQIPFFYLAKLVLPLHLTPEYDTSFAPALLTFPVIVALAMILATGAVALYLNRRVPWLFFCWCWYGTALVPVLHLVPSSTLVADRYAYLPSFAFCLFSAYLLVLLARQLPGEVLLPMAAGGVVMVWSVLSVQQNRIWNSEISLWHHAVTTAPRSVKALDNLGMLYFRRGNYGEALVYLERAGIINPSDPFRDYCLGSLAFDNGDFRRAIKHFDLAVMKKDDLIDALYYIGNAYESLQDKEKAAIYYRRAISSTFPDLRFKLQAAEHLQKLNQLP